MILVLEKIDLKQSLKKDAYNEKMSCFETRLGELQRACRAAGIPVIILFEGWRGSQRNLFLSLFGGSCRQKAIWLCITAAGTI